MPPPIQRNVEVNLKLQAEQFKQAAREASAAIKQLKEEEEKMRRAGGNPAKLTGGRVTVDPTTGKPMFEASFGNPDAPKALKQSFTDAAAKVVVWSKGIEGAAKVVHALSDTSKSFNDRLGEATRSLPLIGEAAKAVKAAVEQLFYGDDIRALARNREARARRAALGEIDATRRAQLDELDFRGGHAGRRAAAAGAALDAARARQVGGILGGGIAGAGDPRLEAAQREIEDAERREGVARGDLTQFGEKRWQSQYRVERAGRAIEESSGYFSGSRFAEQEFNEARQARSRELQQAEEAHQQSIKRHQQGALELEQRRFEVAQKRTNLLKTEIDIAREKENQTQGAYRQFGGQSAEDRLATLDALRASKQYGFGALSAEQRSALSGSGLTSEYAAGLAEQEAANDPTQQEISRILGKESLGTLKKQRIELENKYDIQVRQDQKQLEDGMRKAIMESDEGLRNSINKVAGERGKQVDIQQLIRKLLAG